MPGEIAKYMVASQVERTDELSQKTREAWISVITKDRVVDESLRRQINSGNEYVCEKYFRKEQYECCKHTNSHFNLSKI